MRILLLDDNPQDRFLAKRELQKEFIDADIIEIFEPDAFEREIAASGYDLVVTDYEMGWTNGMAVLERVKNRDRFAPVVMFTATATQETAVAAMKAGLDDYVVKSAAHFVRLSVAARGAIEHAANRRREAVWRCERERLIVELQNANRVKDEFVATVSHELRTPLTSVLGWSQILRSAVHSRPDNVERALDSLERNARVLVQLITDLLDFSGLALRRMELETRVFDVAETLRRTVVAIQPEAQARKLSVHTDCSQSIPIEGDEPRLQRVFDNLFSNALKFTPAGGTITVDCNRELDHVTIEVTDSGIGIGPDFLPHVFDRFRQADSSWTRKYGGLGLGLALSKEIVELHHGSIHVASLGTNQGSTFRVRLPLRQSPRHWTGAK